MLLERIPIKLPGPESIQEDSLKLLDSSHDGCGHFVRFGLAMLKVLQPGSPLLSGPLPLGGSFPVLKLASFPALLALPVIATSQGDPPHVGVFAGYAARGSIVHGRP